MCMCVRVCLYVCASPSGYEKPFVLTEAKITSPAAFRSLFMTLAIDITDRHDLSNEVCHELL